MLLTISGLRSKAFTRRYGVHVGVPGGIEFDLFVRNFLFKHGSHLRTLRDGCIPVLLPQKRVSPSPRRIRVAFTVELGTKLTCRSHPATCRPSNAWGSKSSSDSPEIFWLVYFRYKVMTKSYSQMSLD